MKRLSLVLLGLLLLAALLGGTAALWYRQAVTTPYRGFDEPVTVDIPSGTPSRQILQRLAAAGVVSDPLVAEVWWTLEGRPALRAGEYRFDEPATLAEAVGKLVEGEILLHQVTVVEGLTLDETADALVAAGFGEREAFRAAMLDPAPIADLDPEAETLEGYLFPDTYAFPSGTSEAEVVATMAGTFRERWERRIRPLLEAGEARPVREIVTLASLVEKEAKVPDERPLVAAVYHNRLERGMGLYADPTVVYALKRRGRWDGNIRRDDLRLDDPYNTYRHAGLPPGPIASPGLASLEAAAQPADVPYLYFVSRNDGTHVFAETLREHNRNVAEWQKRYWRRRAETPND